MHHWHYSRLYCTGTISSLYPRPNSHLSSWNIHTNFRHEKPDPLRCTPRQVSMYLCREIISTPLKNIGKALGNRDHTTVMHAVRKVEELIVEDTSMAESIDDLRHALEC